VLGVNYGAGAVTSEAQADLLTVYADLSSRSGTSMISGLDGRIIYPGVWTCTLYYTLGFGASVVFDAQNNADAVFILINSGTPIAHLFQKALHCRVASSITSSLI
jgi:hypothetical protein